VQRPTLASGVLIVAWLAIAALAVRHVVRLAQQPGPEKQPHAVSATSVRRARAASPPCPAGQICAGGIRLAHRYLPPPILASSAALLDVTANRWLLLDHADVPRAMASTTKIMTALVAITHGHLDDVATADAGAVAVGQASGSNMGLVTGERLTIRDLLYGLLLPSGNDAALTIAARVGGTVPAFVAMMNREAAALGMTHTHFANPHGLDEAGHYSSAHDLAILARRALQLPLFRQIVDSSAYAIPATATHRAHRLTNLNWFLTWYPGADGVKPGMTAAAGLCQVLSARRHGRWLIGVLLNTPDLSTDARDLMNYGFGDFHWWPSGRAGDAPLSAIDAGSASDPALYFPATGHRIRAGFLAFYRAHGGAAVFGLPLTDEFVQGEASIQYFSNAVFRWTPRDGVTLEPLGRALLSAHAGPTPVA